MTDNVKNAHVTYRRMREAANRPPHLRVPPPRKVRGTKYPVATPVPLDDSNLGERFLTAKEGEE